MTIEIIQRPTEVIDAITLQLQSYLVASGRTDIEIDDYESWGPNKVGQRFILIEFGDASEAKTPNDGRRAQRQEIILYTLISSGQKNAAREALNVASALAAILRDQRWGISFNCIDEPEKEASIHPVYFEGGEKGCAYEGREVRFWQVIKYGPSQWPEERADEARFGLAINPVDPDNPDEYSEVDHGE